MALRDVLVTVLTALLVLLIVMVVMTLAGLQLGGGVELTSGDMPSGAPVSAPTR